MNNDFLSPYFSIFSEVKIKSDWEYLQGT